MDRNEHFEIISLQSDFSKASCDQTQGTTKCQMKGMPEFSGKQNPGTENFQTERSRTGKFWDQKIPGIPFFPGIREIFF